MRRLLALGMVLVIGVLLMYTVKTNLLEFGTFPDRPIEENSVAQVYLENAFQQTGSANVVTSIVWGYRGYDTVGESIVLFTAVIGVLMVFRSLKERE